MKRYSLLYLVLYLDIDQSPYDFLRSSHDCDLIYPKNRFDITLTSAKN